MTNCDEADEKEDNWKKVFNFLNSYSKNKLVKALFDVFQIENILNYEKKIFKDKIRHYVNGCK